MADTLNKTIWCALTLLVIALICYIAWCFLFMVSGFHYAPQADDYRLTSYHVRPYLDGTWGPKMLWKDVHPNPIHGAILIASAVLENMSFRSLPYILFPFLIIKWFFVSRSLIISNSSSMHTHLLLGLISGYVFFSLSSVSQYVWNSVAIANVYHAVGAIYLYFVAKIFTQEHGKAAPILLFIVAFFFLTTSRQFAIPWVYATVVGALFITIVGESPYRKRGITLVVLLALAVGLDAAFFNLFDLPKFYQPSSKELLTSIAKNWGHKPVELGLFSLAELTLPVVYPWYLEEYGDVRRNTLVILVSLAAAIYAYAVIVATTKVKKQIGLIIPIIIILFVGLTIVGSLAYRTTSVADWLTNHIPRYIVFRNIGIVAVTAILLYARARNLKVRVFNGLVLVTFLSIYAFAQHIHIKHELSDRKRQKLAHNRLVHELQFVYLQLDKEPTIKQDEIIKRYRQQHRRKFRLKLGDPNIPSHRWKLEIIQYWGDNSLGVFNQSLYP